MTVVLMTTIKSINNDDDEHDEGDDRFVEQLLSKLPSFPGPWRSRNCKAFKMFVFQSV